MKSALLPEPMVLAPELARSRVLDYLELTKPRISVLVLFTVGMGGLLASRGHADFLLLVNAVLGTALVASGASALNQWLERHTDAFMRRTEQRPLPAGRLQASEVAVFGFVLGIAGTLYLIVSLPTPVAAWLAAFTFVSYVFVYTPLKRRTTLNTIVGAIPGAMPPVIGWVAVTGRITPEALALFLILFLWQVPHFLAIAWIYRDDYREAGLQMLPVVDPDGWLTARQMVTYCLALVCASLMPTALGWAGPLYSIGALILGAGFTGSAYVFVFDRSILRARRVLKASLVYLPLLLVLLAADVATRW